jgi:hypothetical protein
VIALALALLVQAAPEARWTARPRPTVTRPDRPRRPALRRGWRRSWSDWRDHARGDAAFEERRAWNHGWTEPDAP